MLRFLADLHPLPALAAPGAALVRPGKMAPGFVGIGSGAAIRPGTA